jgi:hypothetical protein
MINVWLKVKSRHSLEFVQKHLNFWLSVFSDKTKYNVYLYNEDVPLPAEYKHLNIVSKKDLFNDAEVKELYDRVQKSKVVTPFWKGAAFALSVPYFFLKEGDLVYNIDADDIVIFGNTKYTLNKLEGLIVKENLPTLSRDMSFSHHFMFPKLRPHHWSFGVNLSNRLEMRKLLDTVYDITIPVMPWGVNIDYMLDVYLEKSKYKYLCFASPSTLVHYENYYCKFHDDGKVEECLKGETKFATRHPRTLWIK